jgi:importin-5
VPTKHHPSPTQTQPRPRHANSSLTKTYHNPPSERAPALLVPAAHTRTRTRIRIIKFASPHLPQTLPILNPLSLPVHHPPSLLPFPAAVSRHRAPPHTETLAAADPMATAEDQAAAAALLGGDPAAFNALLLTLMSSSNNERAAAEAAFHRLRASHPEPLALRLASSLAAPATPAELRAMAGVLLRKVLSPPPASDSSNSAAAAPLWPQLSPAGQTALKSHLLSALQSDPPKPIAKKVCDAISELAATLLPENAWSELLPFLFSAASGPEAPNLQESALLIFARLSDYIAESLLDHLMTIHNLLASALAHPTSPDVRIAALGAVVNLVQCLPTNSDRDKMQDLLPAMMRALTDCLNSGQEASAQEALELLVELAGAEPRFLRRQIGDVVGAMLQVAEAAQLEDGTRHLAVEFVITLAEARERAPGMMRRLPQFVGRLFAVLMQMLLDVEDDPAWHSAETEDEDAGEGNNYGVAQECLDRLAIAIGGNAIVPIASELLPQYLSAPEWQKHHAALITLAQIAEGCAKVSLIIN